MSAVNREQLLQQLELVSPGLSQREIVEQSSCFVFKDGLIQTFNDEISCTHETDVKLSGAVQAKQLIQILRKLTEETVEIHQSKGELIIEGKGKKRETHINMESEIELPVDQVEKPEKWKKLPEEFTTAVSMVQHCAGKDEQTFWPLCIHITAEHIEACDNEQMARYHVAMPVSEPFLVRRDSLVNITSLDVTGFSEGKAWIHFRNKKGFVISFRREDADYPDLTPYFKVKKDSTQTRLPKQLSEVCERAEIFSADNPEENQVSVILRPGKLVIHGKGVSGWHREIKGLKSYKGPKMRFSISPSLLTEIVMKHPDCTISTSKLVVKAPQFSYSASLYKED